MTFAEIATRIHPVFENSWWRVGLILGLAVALAAVLQLLVLPLIHRLSRRSRTDVDDHIFDRLRPALLQTILLEAIHWSVIDFFAGNAVEHYAHRVAVTLLILIWGKAALDVGMIIFRKLSDNVERFAWIQPQTLPLVIFVFKVVVVAAQFYLILTNWNISLTSWLASAGVVGIAVGFAAKDTLANFISGIFILADAPYKVGQYIIIDGDTRGVVTEIGMRSTRLLTRDNVEVTVPNAVIGNAKIVNESSGPSTRMRIRVNVGVAYGSDIDKVRDILLACLDSVPHVSEDEAKAVRFMAMGASALEFQIRVWATHPVYRGRVIDEINSRAYRALTESGVHIPFPQRDLHIKSWPSPPPAGT